jgi:hypothetical protein
MTEHFTEHQIAERYLVENKRWRGILRRDEIIDEQTKFYTLKAKQYRHIESPLLDDVYRDLIADLSIGNRGKRDHRLSLLSLLNACFEAIYNGRESAEVGVLWPTSTSGEADNRYKRSLFSSHARKRAADLLHNKGYVRFFKGGNNPRALMPGLVSLVYPEVKLWALYEAVMESESYAVYDVGFDSQETIILRDEHKRLQDYSETEFTATQREHLSKASSLIQSNEWCYVDEHQHTRIINTSSLTLSRHFHQSSFSVYGRIHSEAQSLKKRDRRTLTINGDETVELDFKGMSAALVYAYAGISSRDKIPYVFEGDAYEIDGAPRKVAKTAFQICLNSSSSKSAQKALRTHYPERVDTNQIISDITFKHLKIQQCFYEGLWMTKLAMMESDIMMAILDHCVGYGLPVLPIHDGLICREKDMEQIHQFMVHCFKRECCGVVPVVVAVRDSSGTKEVLLS